MGTLRRRGVARRTVTGRGGEAFLFYRSPVLEAIAAHLRRRAADISDVTAAYREATAAIDQVLVALVGSHRDGRRAFEEGQPTR